MASAAQVYKRRLQLKARKSGRKRKLEMSRKSTPSHAEYFGDPEASREQPAGSR